MKQPDVTLLKIPSKRRQTALIRLGVTQRDIDATPQISHFLRQIKGGIPAALQILRSSEEQDARKFLAIYDQMPLTVTEALPIEAFCVAANVKPKRLWGMIAEEAIETSSVHAAIIAATHLPAIVEKSIEMSLTDDGSEDRKMQFQHAKYLPTPKGSSTSINIQTTATAAAAAAAQSSPALPPMDAEIKSLSERMNSRVLEGVTPPAALQLEAGAVQYVPDNLRAAHLRDAEEEEAVLVPVGRTTGAGPLTDDGGLKVLPLEMFQETPFEFDDEEGQD